MTKALKEASEHSTLEDDLGESRHLVFVDLAGQGFTSSAKVDGTLTDWKTFYLAYLLGQSMVGIQTDDLLSVSRYVFSQRGRNSAENVEQLEAEIIASGWYQRSMPLLSQIMIFIIYI